MSSLDQRKAERGSSGGRGGWHPAPADVWGLIGPAILLSSIFLGFLRG